MAEKTSANDGPGMEQAQLAAASCFTHSLNRAEQLELITSYATGHNPADTHISLVTLHFLDQNLLRYVLRFADITLEQALADTEDWRWTRVSIRDLNKTVIVEYDRAPKGCSKEILVIDLLFDMHEQGLLENAHSIVITEHRVSNHHKRHPELAEMGVKADPHDIQIMICDPIATLLSEVLQEQIEMSERILQHAERLGLSSAVTTV